MDWKHDPELWLKRERRRFDPIQLLNDAQCPLAFMRGAQSKLVPDDLWAAMRGLLLRARP